MSAFSSLGDVIVQIKITLRSEWKYSSATSHQDYELQSQFHHGKLQRRRSRRKKATLEVCSAAKSASKKSLNFSNWNRINSPHVEAVDWSIDRPLARSLNAEIMSAKVLRKLGLALFNNNSAQKKKTKSIERTTNYRRRRGSKLHRYVWLVASSMAILGAANASNNVASIYPLIDRSIILFEQHSLFCGDI